MFPATLNACLCFCKLTEGTPAGRLVNGFIPTSLLAECRFPDCEYDDFHFFQIPSKAPKWLRLALAGVRAPAPCRVNGGASRHSPLPSCKYFHGKYFRYVFAHKQERNKKH